MNAYDQTRSHSSGLDKNKYRLESEKDVKVCWFVICVYMSVLTSLSEDSLIWNDHGAEAVEH